MPQISPASPGYAYIQVADDLAIRITAGEYPGRLPGERALACEYGVAYPTIRHALAVLRERRLMTTGHSLGTPTSPPPLSRSEGQDGRGTGP